MWRRPLHSSKRPETVKGGQAGEREEGPGGRGWTRAARGGQRVRTTLFPRCVLSSPSSNTNLCNKPSCVSRMAPLGEATRNDSMTGWAQDPTLTSPLGPQHRKGCCPGPSARGSELAERTWCSHHGGVAVGADPSCSASWRVAGTCQQRPLASCAPGGGGLLWLRLWWWLWEAWL